LDLGRDLQHRSDREEQAATAGREADEHARLDDRRSVVRVDPPGDRYTSAGVIEKKKPIRAKNDRPIIVWRISRAGQPLVLALVAVDSRTPGGRTTWTSSMPETESVSSVIAVRSASVLLRVGCDLTSGLPDPNRQPQEQRHQQEREHRERDREQEHRDDRADDRHDTFDSTVEAVSVTTDCTPPTSVREP
jgi:hypothetical protein